MEIDIQKLNKEIKRRLQYHPGDAPWGCVNCYHGRSCMDRDILMLARDHLDHIIEQINECKKYEKYTEGK